MISLVLRPSSSTSPSTCDHRHVVWVLFPACSSSTHPPTLTAPPLPPSSLRTPPPATGRSSRPPPAESVCCGRGGVLRRAIAATVAAVATASDVALLTADTAYVGLLRWAIEASVAAGAATCRGRHSPAGRDAADARRCRRCDHPRKLRRWGLPQPREGDQSAVSLNGVGRHSPAVSGDLKGRRRRWRRDSTDILATRLGGRMQGEL